MGNTLRTAVGSRDWQEFAAADPETVTELLDFHSGQELLMTGSEYLTVGKDMRRFLRGVGRFRVIDIP